MLEGFCKLIVTSAAPTTDWSTVSPLRQKLRSDDSQKKRISCCKVVIVSEVVQIAPVHMVAEESRADLTDHVGE